MTSGVSGFTRQIDIIILCMIPEIELRALRNELSRIGAIHIKDTHTDQKEERYTLKNSNKKELDIVVSCIGGASNLDSAITTLSMLYRYTPRYIFLYGIAGSMQISKYDRGSVVIGSSVVYRKISKVTEEETYQYETRTVEPTPYGQILSRDFMTNNIAGASQVNPLNHSTFKVAHEKIFSWDLVLDSEKIRDNLVNDVDRQISVVEMEAAGFFRAIHHYRDHFISRPFRRDANGGIDGIVVRGVSDHASKKLMSDQDKTPWRSLAADNAAFILMKLIDTINYEDFAAPAVQKAVSSATQYRRRKREKFSK